MKHLSKIFPLLIMLITISVSLAIDPPVKMWEKWYYSSYDGAEFFDIELTDSSELFITGSVYDYTTPLLDGYSAFLMDLDGNVLWEVHHSWYTGRGLDGAVLPDGSFVITGRAVETPSDTYALFIMKIDSEGSIEWTKVYDYPGTREEGYGITCLPDGGFAVCGRVHGTGIRAGEAWILRTDANGDTLWTETWGTYPTNYGKSILFNNNELCVLAMGEDDTLITQGPHLLFYDLDGNYLRGTDYPDLYYIFPGDMCPASDGGYIFVTKTFPSIAHTDSYGELLWRYSIESDPNDEHEGHCIRQTMDGGYIFSGWDGYFEYEPDIDEEPLGSNILINYTQEPNTGDYKEGWLVRFDSEGNELWNFNNLVSHDDFFYSVVQLPEGGYITGGTWTGTGYLVRYAPETGIELEAPSPIVTMNLSPNPFSSELNISFAIPEESFVKVSVYDLSGRLIENLIDDSYTSGEFSFVWNPHESVSEGCYIIKMSTSVSTESVRCMYII